MRRYDREGVVTRRRAGHLILFAATAGLLVGFAGSLYAALPPIYQIWREFGMITGDAQIPQMLGAQGPVERIERVQDGYRVWAGHCYIPVAVVPIERDPKAPIIVGPAQVRTESRPVQCR